MKKVDTNFLEPSQKQLHTLFEYYKNKQYIEAEKLSLSITQEFPKNQFAWKVLAAVLKQNGKLNESLIISQKSVQLDPQDPEAHNNLGALLQEQGRLKEAEASYKKAILLKPDYAEAHNNLGNSFQILGRLKKAEKSYRKVIELKPSHVEAHNNLGILLQKQRKLNEACYAYIKAISLNSDFTQAYVNLGTVIKNLRFNSSNTELYPYLIRLINKGNFVRPMNVVSSILSLLKHDPIIKDLLLEENFATNLEEVNSIISKLDKLKLLHHLMRVCPIPDLKFEKFFVGIRRLLITNLDNFKLSPELIYFLSTLSLHCFTNEYIYNEKNEETELIENLEHEIMQTFANSEQPEVKKILCLASYRPLHLYNWYHKLKALDHLEEVKSRLIKEPYVERKIKPEIPILGVISNDVSRKVKEQYEENPYPRWVKTGIHIKAKSILEICAEMNIRLYSESIKKVIAPSILIAGCGTGQHPIGTASYFSNCQVKAVDLSLASLAYAKRKSAELGITNLEYLQADILRLNQLEKKFNIIETMGVLHHMDKPMAGWRVLTDILKPGGLMRIGLYSELARQHIVKVRNEIKLMKMGTSKSEIRKFRQYLAESKDENHQLLSRSRDFFSLSSLRDLIFHVQEHRFTIPQIKNCLDELNLKFCGFTTKNTISNFRRFHGKNSDIYDLSLWRQYEESNPQAFASMYQFWCQKV